MESLWLSFCKERSMTRLAKTTGNLAALRVMHFSGLAFQSDSAIFSAVFV